jgi:TetR/AcrR family transcriptional regulator, cholesterol catabolism regulator
MAQATTALDPDTTLRAIQDRIEITDVLYRYASTIDRFDLEGLRGTLESFLRDFERITGESDDYLDALITVLRASYDLSEQEVLRNRLLVAEQGLIGIPRQSRREEEARELARARTRDLEFAWATFLIRGMEQGHIPQADARLLTRALLGLYNSVWHWYRPRGTMGLDEIADFFIRRQLAVLSVDPTLADQPTVPR